MDDDSQPMAVFSLEAGLALEAMAIFMCLRRNGFSAYVVGGFVRDLLCGLPSHDLDIVTDATAVQIFQLFDRVSIIGRRHQLAVVRNGSHCFELSTLVTEPGDPTTPFQRIRADAATRDFCINALYWDPLAAKVYDPCGGLADLHAGRLRCIGDPAVSLDFDPIRLLRAARLAAWLGFGIDPALLEAMRRTEIAWDPESCWRAARELVRMGGARPSSAWRLLDNVGKLCAFLPMPREYQATRTDEAFLRAALSDSDAPYTPGFLIAALLWPSFCAKMTSCRDRSSPRAHHTALDELIRAQRGLLRQLINKYDGSCRNILLLQLSDDDLQEDEAGGGVTEDAKRLARARQAWKRS